jgi:hypothetical protein
MVDVSRRAVLGAGATVVGALIVGTVAEASPAGAATTSTKTTVPLTRSLYSGQIGRTFTAVVGRQSHQLTLNRILNVDGATSAQANTSFNLIFTSKSRPAEGIYTISRTGVAAQRFFLGHLGDGESMQALVNRTR